MLGVAQHGVLESLSICILLPKISSIMALNSHWYTVSFQISISSSKSYEHDL